MHLPLILMALAAQPTLEELYRGSLIRTATPVSDEERNDFRVRFERLLAGATAQAPGRKFQELSSEQGYTVLKQEAPRGGHGFFAVRRDGAPLFLQAPHAAGDDLQTGEITFRLTRALRPRALALSTTARDEVDLAHERESLFQTATTSFAGHQQEAPWIVQIHGFAQDKRRTAAGREAEVILSSGSRRPSPGVENLSTCLGAVLGARVGVFPRVPELGALTNVQGQALPAGSFVHIELSRELRRRLADGVGIDGLAKCLEKLVQ